MSTSPAEKMIWAGHQQWSTLPCCAGANKSMAADWRNQEKESGSFQV